MEIRDVSCYSLQIGETAEAQSQLEQIPESLRPVNLAPRIRDWGDTAAFMQQMDLLISVDTGVVHLAGALNRPTWVMLYKGADWRYPESGQTPADPDLEPRAQSPKTVPFEHPADRYQLVRSALFLCDLGF